MGSSGDKAVLCAALIIVLVITLIVLLFGGSGSGWPGKRPMPPAQSPCAWVSRGPTAPELIAFVNAFKGGGDSWAWTAQMLIAGWRKQSHWGDINDFAAWAQRGLAQDCWHPQLREAVRAIVAAARRSQPRCS